MSFLMKGITRGHQLRDAIATKGFKRLRLDECGVMSLDSLAKEAIAVLILIKLLGKDIVIEGGRYTHINTVDTFPIICLS